MRKRTLKIEQNFREPALRMALKDNKAPKIHHSDKGSQYTYKSYTDLLESHATTISMALSAQDNAYAERINRTIKEEYLDHWKPQSFSQLRRQVKNAVNNYNNKRSHDHLNKRNPEEFFNYWSTLQPEKRPVTTIFDNEN